MEPEKPEPKLNPKAVLITMAVFILIPIVYVLFIKKDTVEAPPATIQTQTETETPVAVTTSTDNIEHIETAIKTKATETNYIDLSLAYFSAKEYQKSIEASRKAIAINPNSIIAYNNICCAYNNLGLWDSAIVAGQAALSINPNFQLAKNNLQWAFQMKKK